MQIDVDGILLELEIEAGEIIQDAVLIVHVVGPGANEGHVQTAYHPTMSSAVLRDMLRYSQAGYEAIFHPEDSTRGDCS